MHLEGTCMYRYGNGQISLSDFPQARGTLPQSCSGRQNLPNLRKSPLLQREGYPAVRPCSGKAQERRGTEQSSGLPRRMCEQVEVERKFSLGKRKCGMGLVTAKLEDTAAHVVALSILLLNLRKIQYTFLQFLDWLLGFLQPCEKLGAVQ